jgi:hypothetical protein
VTALEIWLISCLLILFLAIMQLLVSYKTRTNQTKQTSSTNRFPIFSESENNLIEMGNPVRSDPSIKEKTTESPTQTINIVEGLEESFSHLPTLSNEESKTQSTFPQSPSTPLFFYILTLVFSSFTCLYWIFFLYFI